MNVYFISGLGADSRVFRNIRLPRGYEAVYLEWIRAGAGENLESYACRLAEKIDKRDKFVLIGLSMGGMIAVEIAKHHKPVTTILISSAATFRQFPRRFRAAYFFRLHRMIPPQLFKSMSIIKRLFAGESKEDRKMLLQLIRDSDPVFIQWAINAILEWKNDRLPEPMIHIHGTKDEILPIKHTRPTHIIHKGTHLMILNRAEEINELLKSVLPSLEKGTL